MTARLSIRSALAAALLLATGPAGGETMPGAGGRDERVRVARYVDGEVYRINVSLLRVTSVEFGDDEEIRSIVAGDTGAFDFDTVPGGKAMVVKPLIAKAATNITVYTTRRSYYLQVAETVGTPFYVVRFMVPKTGAGGPASKAVVRDPPFFGYGADSLTSITPVAVWDDGTFTYFRFRRNETVPAIFRVSDGTERTSNTTAVGDGTIRVSGVSRYWVLRAGAIENTIARLGGPP